MAATEPEVLRSPLEVWGYLVSSGGLQPESWDAELVDNLLGRRRAPKDGTAEERIARSSVTTEEFVVAFLSTVEPFAKMLDDLLALFARAGVRETNANAAIAFDFSAVNENDLSF